MPGPGFNEDRPGQVSNDERHRQQEKETTEQVDPALRPSRQASGDDVDADMLVAPERIAGAQKKNRREKVPLQLEPRIRADIERITHERVQRADQHRDQDQPIDATADQVVERIDRPAQSQEDPQDTPHSIVATAPPLISSGIFYTF